MEKIAKNTKEEGGRMKEILPQRIHMYAKINDVTTLLSFSEKP